MKKRLLVAVGVACASIASGAFGGIRYVNAAAPPGGDGLTWATAYRTLQPALTAAQSQPADIWIAQGTYKPEIESTPGVSQTKVFLVPKSTALYGGFVGGESSFGERDPEAHPTILSGDLLENDSSAAGSLNDNAHNVVRASGSGVRTLDGLIITGGNRVNDGFNGGAVCAIGATVKLNHCVLRKNRSGWGGGVYGEAGAFLLVQDCAIRDNVASNHGGGLYANGATVMLLGGTVERNSTLNGYGGGVRTGVGTVIASGVLLRKNVANGPGGGMMVTEGPVLVENCDFVGNSATSGGGGLYVQGASTTVNLCLFEANKASDAGGCGIALGGQANAITACVFRSNSVTSSSGGLSLGNGGTYSVSNCAFQDNSAGFQAGGLGAFSCSVAIDSCTFEENRSPQSAGLDVQNSTFVFTNSLVRANRGGGGGGRIVGAANTTAVTKVSNVLFEANQGSGFSIDFVNNASALVTDCVFRGNVSDTGFGGLRIDRNAGISRCRFEENYGIQGGGVLPGGWDNITTTFANCTFTGNVSTANAIGFGGGAVDAAYNGTHEFMNCVFSGNIAQGAGQGGAFKVASNSKIKLENCTLAGNVGNGNSAGIFVGTGSTASATLRNCILWGNGGGTQAQQIFSQGPPLSLSSTTVQGWTGSLGGVGNNGSNPFFVDANGADNVVGTFDDDLRLQLTSPAINSGSLALLPPDLLDLDGDGDTLEPLPLDLDDNLRAVGPVDRGAYESQR